VLAANVAGTGITASYSSTTETLTLSGADTLAHYQQVLDSVTFSAGENPTNYGSNPTRTLSWVVDDGAGSFHASTAQTSTVSISNVNDAPTLANVAAVSGNFTEGGAAVTVSGSVLVIDPDNLTLADARVVVGNGFAGDGDLLSASTAGTGIAASYNSATETLTLSGVDTLAHYQQVLDTVTFRSSSQNPTNYGSNLSRVLTWTLDDGSASSNLSASQFTTVVITAVNNAPSLSNVTPKLSFAIGQTVTVSPALTVSDPDNLNLAGATVSVTGGTFAGDGDVLSANVAGTAITASYNAATERLTLTGTDTLAHYQSVLDSVAFSSGANPSNSGQNPSRTLSWVVDDGAASNDLSTPATTTISIGVVKNDFDGSGKSDILWQNDNGLPGIWLMNGTSLSASGGLPNPGPSWHEIGTGDFNSDGKADILWQNDNGSAGIWLMNATSLLGSVALPSPGAGWHLTATGDFNGDGKSEILLRNDDGTPQIWQMNGTSVAASALLPNPGTSWHPIGTGDFNGDRQADILWQNDSGLPGIWYMNGTSYAGGGVLPNPGASWHAIGTGDFDGDGKADILWQNDNGSAGIWTMNGTSLTGSVSLPNPGAGWHLIGTDDFNGDGKSDILLRNADGTPQVWLMSPTSVATAATLPNPTASWHPNTG
jgi:lipopolysaccharide export system protein LptA